MSLQLTIPWRQKKKVNVRKPKEPEKTFWQSVAERLPDAGVVAVVTLGVSVIAAGGMLWTTLMDPQTLPVKQLQLEAPFNKVSKEQLFDVIQPNAHGGFFNVDVDAVTTAVESLPWVEYASVRRIWPDALHVSVREQTALARWQDQALVNVSGELFFPAADSFPQGLIELDGPKSTVAQMADQFNAFKNVLGESELQMESIRLTERRAWEVHLTNGATVVLGRCDVKERLQRFVEFYPRLSAQLSDAQHVDMRYTNGFAVKWQVPAA